MVHAHILGNHLPLVATTCTSLILLLPPPQRLNFFGGAELSNEQLFELSEAEDNHGESRVVVLANVWLDKPEVLKGLADVLKGESISGCSGGQ